MTLTTTTHLNFHGEAREALAFYAAAFGGDSTVTTYGDLGMPAGLPDSDKVVFGAAFSPVGFRVMAYDVPGRSEPRAVAATHRENGTTVTDSPFFVAFGGDSLGEVTGPWTALSEGATVIEPLAASAWSPGFGMLTDRFGVTWTVSVAPAS
ncbi:VOC family protein [Labedella populi]|uniref:VOC family protein n=1 Tax=Labedella populi TaxID=2498850 RepID=A0A3S4DYT7_9MICO|nr:VOC family protein [Labedella populi]RWZ59304.1 VOC family protein [Labedella populi]